MNKTRRADCLTWGTSWSPRPSALEIPTPEGPTMADIMIMARPAPPASWIMLRQSSIIGPAAVTSTTDSPVVVQPLTDSKTDLENGSPRTEVKGQAEKRMTVIQLTTTIIPPS